VQSQPRPELAAVRLPAARLSPDPGARRSLQPVTNPQLEEPDALIALVRICGGRRPAFGPGGPIPDPPDVPW